MEMIIPTGEKLTFELSDVSSIYDKIPEKPLFGVKRFSKIYACSEIDARSYFSAYWSKGNDTKVVTPTSEQLANKMVYINSNGVRKYAIPKPNEKNCEIVMTLFIYLTFFANTDMARSEIRRAIIKATSQLFPVLKDNWSTQMLDIFNETVKQND